jgi:MraZ protein
VDVFVGTFEHSLDDKGRVVLPRSFRAALTGTGGYLSQFDRCLGLWTEEGFDEMAQRLIQKVRDRETTQDALRAFSSNAHVVSPDGQGRITIPPRLRQFADLQGEAVLIGAIDRIEIWNATRWQDQTSTADESYVKAVTALGL